MKIPVVELSLCIRCGICVDLCPEVFRLNDADYVEVTEVTNYPELEINDAMTVLGLVCPHCGAEVNPELDICPKCHKPV